MNTGVLSLNNDQNFQDLTCMRLTLRVLVRLAEFLLLAFLTAAGYASADVLYNINDPPFVHNGYTIASLVVRLSITR